MLVIRHAGIFLHLRDVLITVYVPDEALICH